MVLCIKKWASLNLSWNVTNNASSFDDSYSWSSRAHSSCSLLQDVLTVFCQWVVPIQVVFLINTMDSNHTTALVNTSNGTCHPIPALNNRKNCLGLNQHWTIKHVPHQKSFKWSKHLGFYMDNYIMYVHNIWTSTYRKQGKIRWAKFSHFQFSGVPQKFLCEYNHLSLIILNNE